MTAWTPLDKQNVRAHALGMGISLGIFIGLAIAFVIWRWEIRNKGREEMAFDLYVDFLKLCRPRGFINSSRTISPG